MTKSGERADGPAASVVEEGVLTKQDLHANSRMRWQLWRSQESSFSSCGGGTFARHLWRWQRRRT